MDSLAKSSIRIPDASQRTCMPIQLLNKQSHQQKNYRKRNKDTYFWREYIITMQKGNMEREREREGGGGDSIQNRERVK